MIDVSTALHILQSNTSVPAPAMLPLQEATGFTLAADVKAPRNMPAFRQSAMDGYAFDYAAWDKISPLQIASEVAAGATKVMSLLAGQAARIFTGAPMPEGADTVVMQEKTSVTDKQLHVLDTALQAGSNVRPIGSEIGADELALPAGTLLTPAATGLLAALGFTNVAVYPPPRVSIVVTGNELQTPGLPLAPGQVYESNSWSLRAALEPWRIKEVTVRHAPDDPQQIVAALAAALEEADILLVTGGVSVGDYDYVAQSLTACGVETLFHRIRQKPGKPLFAGRKEDKIVFGLPGNPSSVLTCFYEYVRPVIAWRMQHPGHDSSIRKLPLTHDHEKPPGLTHFLKARSDGQEVTLLTGQESYKLNTFALANCLVALDADRGQWKAGEEVAVHFIS
ncbi:molybdopterin molybdotransferase MoeA [Chitinophaga horti]|uniref:Molybdopterin molybdenumtransferase n=1 Tax=Chitinophaga horti TaxID=2920382 RepID=A0ABY6IVZ7_9BACT|nr:gephyrin-like molybdotransferase Glp [Chitinophaga horti]UYQ91408.1 molybdopterin molybdotransferase MoeA [Chitinophaga horti]